MTTPKKPRRSRARRPRPPTDAQLRAALEEGLEIARARDRTQGPRSTPTLRERAEVAVRIARAHVAGDAEVQILAADAIESALLAERRAALEEHRKDLERVQRRLAPHARAGCFWCKTDPTEDCVDSCLSHFVEDRLRALAGKEGA